ncbi:zinc finger and SCAN domain-containing protein 10-like isoform X2 [Leguminivora glycinivorella]|uniref:zinc finger and SCAN domain-containing protein 10-like isoform X2 n=1 Tax=Leguminivora glycinivorella TaxID=1035111 RepID=UPI00200EC37B|nr:zinc finger and SCAN domain-containing protein 10-like isoform X2 [Leguminivora glycinivorella]
MSTGTEQIFLPDSARNLPHGAEMMRSTRPGNGAPTINTTNLENVSDFSKVCRVCATVTELVIPIYGEEGLRNNLADKIKRHLPIKVTENDVLPLVVCFQCSSTLLATHELVACSLQADAALRTVHAQRVKRERRAQPPPPPPPPVEPELDTEGIVEDRPDKNVKFKAVVKDVLVNYFHTLNMDEGDECQFACQQCSWRGNSTELLVGHLLAHRIKSDDVDSFIRQCITFEEPLESDEDTTEPPTVKFKPPEPLAAHCCPFCDCVFSSTARLGLHIAEHVEISEDSAVECCGALYSDRSLFLQHALDKHGRAPLPGIVCRACGQTADSHDTLAEHIKNAHADDAITRKRTSRNPKSKDQKYIPIPCPECGKTYSNKYNMAVHLRSHKGTAEKIQCELCRKWYGSRGALVSHVKLSHGGLLRFACGACGERFPSRAARAAHAARHSGRRPHACALPGCSGAFRSRDSLLKHLAAHRNERTYACHCGKAFNRRWHLKRHMKTHQENGPLKKDSDPNNDAT